MAISSAQGDTGDNGDSQETGCPGCGTVFQVSRELLDSPDTRVRCGECFAIFDARTNRVRQGGLDGDAIASAGSGVSIPEPSQGTAPSVERESADDGSLAGPGSDTDPLDVTYSDFDLFSDEAGLPEVAYFDQTRDAPDLDFDLMELGDDETFADTLFEYDETVHSGTGDGTVLEQAGGDVVAPGSDAAVGGASIDPVLARDIDVIANAAPRTPLAFRYRDADPEPGRDASDGSLRAAPPGDDGTVDLAGEPLLFDPPASRRSLLLPTLLLLAFAVLLAGLYGFQRIGRFADDPFTRMVYIGYCRVTGCTVPPRSALDRVELLRRNVYSHPNIDDALVIDVSFRNAATFAQAWPALEIQLSDPSGRLVARRTFEPVEYLPDGVADDVIDAGTRQDVSLDVNDPGQNASSFEVDFVTARDQRSGSR